MYNITYKLSCYGEKFVEFFFLIITKFFAIRRERRGNITALQQIKTSLTKRAEVTLGEYEVT